MIQYDATGIDAGQPFPLLPNNQWFPFRITHTEETASQKGHPMVKVIAEPQDARYPGIEVWHYIVFLPKEQKGASIAIHFLKCIGQPFEGKINPDPLDWRGCKFLGKVIVSEYNGKKNNKIVEISPFRDGAIGPELAENVGDDPFAGD